MATGVQGAAAATKSMILFVIAQRIADQMPGYFARAGPEPGNVRSNLFMNQLKSLAKDAFAHDYSEAKLCVKTN